MIKSLSRPMEKRMKRAFSEKIKGEFYFDMHTRLLYSTAACMYRKIPMGVVCPRDGDDVSAIIDIARSLKIPVTARGAGVSRTGNSLSDGLIVDFSKHMNRILSLDSTNQRVLVEPGIVLNDLNRALLKHHLFFPPDPSSGNYCTIGGMVANNAAGARSVKYGSTGNFIQKLSVVLDDGSETVLGSKEMPVEIASNRTQHLINGIDQIITRHGNDIERYFPKTSKNSSGYLVNSIRDESGAINMAHMFAASEGTLGLFTGIELSVEKIPPADGVILFFCESIEAAGEAVLKTVQFHPSMLEIMADTFITLVRRSAFHIGIPFPQTLKSILLVEFQGEDIHEVEDRIDLLEQELLGPGRPATSAIRGIAEKDKIRLMKLRKAASPILNRLPPPMYPTRFIEDGIVSIEKLPVFLEGLQAILDNHQIEGVIFGHAGEGHLHVNPLMDVSSKGFKSQMESIAADATHLIKSLDGSLSGEHGDGLVRSPFLPQMFEGAYDAFCELKYLFDPDGIFNPGMIVGGENYNITDNLKIFDILHPVKTETQLDESYFSTELWHCSGCGACRAYCPVFLAVMDEQATPRAKANLLTWIVTGHGINNRDGIGPEEKSILDLCTGCGKCLVECPSGVNIPRLVSDAKEVFHTDWGIPLVDRLLTSTHFLGMTGRAGGKMLRNPEKSSFIRKAMELFLDIDRNRKLPGINHSSYHIQAPGLISGIQVAYISGCFAEFYDSSGEAESILYILQHLGFSPYVPQMKCCGIAKFSAGLKQTIRRDAIINVDVLTNLAEQRYRTVTGSPSCLLAFRQLYPEYLNTDKAKKAVEEIKDIHEFLIELLTKGQLDMEFQPLPYRIAFHQPCHSQALGIGELPYQILTMIPGLDLINLTAGCCGMSGTFGLSKQHYGLSEKVGAVLFREILREKPDFVASACGTCRMQIEQNTDIPTVHPMEILAMAYGRKSPLKGVFTKQ